MSQTRSELDTRYPMEIKRDPALLNKIVDGFLHDLNKTYNLCQEIPESIYSYTKLFYITQGISADNKHIPFTILFTIYNAKSALSIQGWDQCDINQQCNYLQLNNISTKTKRDIWIKNLLQKTYNLDYIPTELKTNIITEVGNVLTSFYSDIDHQLLDNNDMNDWTQRDILLSFIYHIIIESNKQIISTENTGSNKFVWEFVETFRKYLVISQKNPTTKWNGSVLLQSITTSNITFSNDLQRLIRWRFSSLSLKPLLITPLLQSWIIDLYHKYHTSSLQTSLHKSDLQFVNTGQQFIYKPMPKLNAEETIKLIKYRKMQKMRLPETAIKNKMKSDNIDDELITKFFNQPQDDQKDDDDDDDSDKMINQNKNNLLIAGYSRREEMYLSHTLWIFIPNDVKQLIEQFYGKTYAVATFAPSKNEFDYAVEFLLPMKRIGINLNKTETKITKCHSEFAQKNIIPNSEIIQINDSLIKGKELTVEENDKLWEALKRNGKSFIILRASKELNQIGTHLLIDITLNDKDREKLNNKLFPYWKFEPVKILKAFKNLLSDYKNVRNMEIISIYANKKCLSNNGEGLTFSIFIDDDKIDLNGYLLIKLKYLLEKECKLKEEEEEGVMMNIEVNVAYLMRGLRGYGIETAWSEISTCYWTDDKMRDTLASLVYLVKGVDEGRNAWYYIMVDINHLQQFKVALDNDIIHLEQYGKILSSAYGDTPPTVIADKLKETWLIHD